MMMMLVVPNIMYHIYHGILNSTNSICRHILLQTCVRGVCGVRGEPAHSRAVEESGNGTGSLLLPRQHPVAGVSRPRARAATQDSAQVDDPTLP